MLHSPSHPSLMLFSFISSLFRCFSSDVNGWRQRFSSSPLPSQASFPCARVVMWHTKRRAKVIHGFPSILSSEIQMLHKLMGQQNLFLIQITERINKRVVSQTPLPTLNFYNPLYHNDIHVANRWECMQVF